jgi:sortase A
VAIRFPRKIVASILLLAGAAALGAALAGYFRGVAWQRLQAAQEDPVLAWKGARELSPDPGGPFARLLIPRIDLDVVVVEGTRKEDLLKGPGHLAGSAPPGAAENCIIAGHRDLHFRNLGRLGPGNLVRLEVEGRVFDYRVEAVRVVSPEDTSVLAPGHDPLLTLVTCYPFRYVGPAPNRFVVRARLSGVARAALEDRAPAK